MMTSDDDGWVDKSGAEGRVASSRRDEETRGNAEEYGGRGREVHGKWKGKCTRMNTAGGAREDDERDETSRARRIEESHPTIERLRPLARTSANLLSVVHHILDFFSYVSMITSKSNVCDGCAAVMARSNTYKSTPLSSAASLG